MKKKTRHFNVNFVLLLKWINDSAEQKYANCVGDELILLLQFMNTRWCCTLTLRWTISQFVLACLSLNQSLALMFCFCEADSHQFLLIILFDARHKKFKIQRMFFIVCWCDTCLFSVISFLIHWNHIVPKIHLFHCWVLVHDAQNDQNIKTFSSECDLVLTFIFLVSKWTWTKSNSLIFWMQVSFIEAIDSANSHSKLNWSTRTKKNNSQTWNELLEHQTQFLIIFVYEKESCEKSCKSTSKKTKKNIQPARLELRSFGWEEDGEKSYFLFFWISDENWHITNLIFQHKSTQMFNFQWIWQERKTIFVDFESMFSLLFFLHQSISHRKKNQTQY